MQKVAHDAVAKWIVNDAQFAVEDDTPIGDGASGKVYRARYAGHNVVAKRELSQHDHEDPEIASAIANEVSLLLKLRSPNIVNFFGLYISDDTTQVR